MKAWHFSGERLGYNLSDIEVKTGLHLKHHDELIVIGSCGLHASINIMDALSYARGSYLSRVELRGCIIHDRKQSAASERFHVEVHNIEQILDEFSVWCAEQALSLINDPDERSLNALCIKRLWLDGKATNGELVTARDAAWAVWWDADRHLENIAARNVRCATKACWAAAAVDTAYISAKSTSKYAARAAIWTAMDTMNLKLAAAAVVGDAARAAQSAKLMEMISSVFKEVVPISRV